MHLSHLDSALLSKSGFVESCTALWARLSTFTITLDAYLAFKSLHVLKCLSNAAIPT